MEAVASPFLTPDFLAKLEKLRLVAKRLSWGNNRGEHPSARRGYSLEFSDYKRYHRGDDLRYVDWNIYGRLERLLLKVFIAEEEMNLYLLLDTSRSMGEGRPSKLDFAKNVAAALGYIGLKTHDRVGAVTFAGDVVAHLPLGRSRRQILALFKFLADLPCGGETHLETAIKSFSMLFPRRGLVVVLSDLWDPRGCQAGLEELAKNKYDILVIHILAPGENAFRPQGDVSLVDAESEKERRLFFDSDLVRRFNEEIERYLGETASFCHRRSIDYLKTTTSIAFDEFVLHYLKQARRIG